MYEWEQKESQESVTDGYQWRIAEMEPMEQLDLRPKPKKKHTRRNLGVLLAIVAVIVGFLVYEQHLQSQMQSLIEQYLEEGADWDDEGYWDDYELEETTIARAATGMDYVLPLEARGAQEQPFALTQLYKECVDSIVYIYTYGNGRYDGEGSGIIMREDGYILTNAHVIEGGYEVEVLLNDERYYDATLVGMDRETDLAVLKIEAEGLPAARFSDLEALEVGEQVVTIGNPYGYELRGSMSDGIVAAIDRSLWNHGSNQQYIQTTAPISSGSSGGALLDTYGRVVGVTTLKYVTDLDAESFVENVGFAIPTTKVRQVVQALMKNGEVKSPPQLGISVVEVDELLAETAGVASGLQVQSITIGGAAEEANLRIGDVIVQAQGEDISQISQLLALRDACEAGDTLELRVYRDGEYLDITLLLKD